MVRSLQRSLKIVIFCRKSCDEGKIFFTRNDFNGSEFSRLWTEHNLNLLTCLLCVTTWGSNAPAVMPNMSHDVSSSLNVSLCFTWDCMKKKKKKKTYKDVTGCLFLKNDSSRVVTNVCSRAVFISRFTVQNLKVSLVFLSASGLHLPRHLNDEKEKWFNNSGQPT